MDDLLGRGIADLLEVVMFCPNCASKLKPVEEILSQDNWGGDYYTHVCSTCPAYWHLHISGDTVNLISTKSQEIASKKIVRDLVTVLKEKATKLEK